MNDNPIYPQNYRFVEPGEIWNLMDNGYDLLDVRSPGEYQIGHIAKAVSLPLFDDMERHAIGILYKEQGRDAAILKGLEYVGPRLQEIVKELTRISAQKKVLIHCWRGGLRSSSVAWLCATAGFEVQVVRGGYKAYREYCRQYLHKNPIQLLVIGGQTGSGKTMVLQELKRVGEQVLDLEFLAHHKGSAFGWIGEYPQSSNEQFENELFDIIKNFDLKRVIWIENESRKIGKNYIPEWLWEEMKIARLIQIKVSMDQRLQHLIKTYKTVNSDDLKHSFSKIRKKIGYLQEQKAIQYIEEGKLEDAARIALQYYDSCYTFDLQKSNARDIVEFSFKEEGVVDIALTLIEHKHKMSWNH